MIAPLFAQAASEPTPASYGLWIMIGFSVISGISTLVSLVSIFATKTEVQSVMKRLESHEEVHQQVFNKINGMEQMLRGEFREDFKTMRDEIHAATSAIAAVSQSAQMLNQQLIEARGRIDRMKDTPPR